MPVTPANTIKRSTPRESRRLARLTAVQALYQADVMQQSAVLVLKEFEAHRLQTIGAHKWLHDAESGERLGSVDVMLMRDVVALALQHRATLEELLAKNLPKDWPLHRLEKPLLMILLAGAAEIYQRADTPAALIINDYVDIAHAFYEGKEPGLVNAILDTIAKTLRG
jgi:N utilization substance protein B